MRKELPGIFGEPSVMLLAIEIAGGLKVITDTNSNTLNYMKGDL